MFETRLPSEAWQPTKEAALDFFEAAYLAGAELAGWDIVRYACVDGVTDPLRAAVGG